MYMSISEERARQKTRTILNKNQNNKKVTQNYKRETSIHI